MDMPAPETKSAQEATPLPVKPEMHHLVMPAPEVSECGASSTGRRNFSSSNGCLCVNDEHHENISGVLLSTLHT